MCGRREVTRKTLAETRTVRKKKSNTEPTSYFLLKSISSESPALCRRRGYDKSPPRAATYITCTLGIIRSQHVQHNNLHRICGGGGFLFFKRDACIIHRIASCSDLSQKSAGFEQVHVSHLHSAFEAAVERSRSVFKRLYILRAELRGGSKEEEYLLRNGYI